MIQTLDSALTLLRAKKPLVLCLTNFVTMDFMANSLLALGAAPLMSCDEREIDELVKLSASLMINIGTLDKAFVTRAEQAMLAAKRYQKPIVLDPVGAGATVLRTKVARQFLASSDIVRANASEAIALLENSRQTQGVESVHEVNEATLIARQLATDFQCTLAVSGKIDFVSDGHRETFLPFGSPLMSQVTGMGCCLTAIIAAFRAVVSDSFEASVLGTTYVGLCGSLAALETKHPASFKTAFIDQLHQANWPAMQVLQQNSGKP